MRKKTPLLVVVDMQNDFISGSLGSDSARAIVQNVCDKIKSWQGDIVYTMDTHGADYPETMEGSHILFEHCIRGSHGWQLHPDVESAIKTSSANPICIQKSTFGSLEVASILKSFHTTEVTLIGLCTDICVIANAIIALSASSQMSVTVDANCCAGVTPESHIRALQTMQLLGIQIENAPPEIDSSIDEG